MLNDLFLIRQSMVDGYTDFPLDVRHRHLLIIKLLQIGKQMLK